MIAEKTQNRDQKILLIFKERTLKCYESESFTLTTDTRNRVNSLTLIHKLTISPRASSSFGAVETIHARAARERRRSASRGFVTRSRVLSRLASLAITGDLARRLMHNRKSSRTCKVETDNSNSSSLIVWLSQT